MAAVTKKLLLIGWMFGLGTKLKFVHSSDQF